MTARSVSARHEPLGATAVTAFAVLTVLSVPALSQCVNCAGNLNLPPSAVISQRVTATPISQSYIRIMLTGIGSGYDLIDGAYLAWCSDDSHAPVVPAPTVTPYSTYSPNLPANIQNANWPKVNYVLNHKQGTYRDVQQTIWLLLRGQGSFVTSATVSAMLRDAAINGAKFVPAPGEKIAVVMYQDGFGNNQDTIVETTTPECGVIGDVVWLDSNSNGLQDDGDTGVNNVKVNLFSSSGALLSSVVTGPSVQGNGVYRFNNLCQGGYTVELDSSTLPANVIPTLRGIGSDRAVDSSTGSETTFLAARNSKDLTLDFGVAPGCQATLGNFVWHDLNKNGKQDVGEPGIPGVTLTLTNGLTTRSTTTDSNGGYGFTGLCPGAYSVSVVQSTVPWATFIPTISNAAGVLVAENSNPSPSSTTLNAASSTDLTLDFGFVPGANCTLTQGYWKNHENKWPLATLTLGGKTYTQDELVYILNAPVSADDSIRLAYQLIAAKLNIYNSATPSTVPQWIQLADQLLSTYSGKIPLGIENANLVPVASQLDNYNNGRFAGTNHCN
jgi:hypothetical protein